MQVPSIIRKTASDLRVAPNFGDYDAQRRAFSWTDAARELAGLPGGGLNIAFEAVDRHAAGALRDRTAFRFLSADAPPHDMSYGELSRQSNRFANVLRALGVAKGDRVFLLLGREPALYVALLGGLNRRLGADIPEADYARVATLDDIVRYFAGRLNDDRP